MGKIISIAIFLSLYGCAPRYTIADRYEDCLRAARNTEDRRFCVEERNMYSREQSAQAERLRAINQIGQSAIQPASQEKEKICFEVVEGIVQCRER